MRPAIRRALTTDPRALGLYRVGLGAVILLDLATRLPDVGFFLGSQGPLPLSALVVDTNLGKVAFSLYSMSSYAAWPVLLYLATALGALALLLGRRCGWVTPVLFVLMLSLQNRTGVALDFGDRLILVGLFFGIFLPWDRAYVYGQARLEEGDALQRPASWLLGWLTLGMCQVAFLHFLWASPSPLSMALALAPGATLLSVRRWRAGVLIVFGLLLALTWLFFEVGLTPLAVGAGLLLWIPFEADPHEASQGTSAVQIPPASHAPAPQAPTWLLALAAAIIAATSLLTFLPPTQQPQTLRNLGDFLALSPERGQAFPPPQQQHLEYLVVLLNSQGERSTLTSGTPLNSTYRKRLYLQSLNDDANWGLRYWLAFWYFRQEERRLASESPRQVEVYQRNAQGDQRLVARWPMTPMPRPRTP